MLKAVAIVFLSLVAIFGTHIAVFGMPETKAGDAEGEWNQAHPDEENCPINNMIILGMQLFGL